MAPPATDSTLLSPKDLDDGNGEFAFAHTDMISLMRYVTEGCLLPTTVDAYTTNLGFKTTDLTKEVLTELKSMLGSYGQVGRFSWYIFTWLADWNG